MLDGAQALTFTRTRQAAELVHRYVKEQLDGAAFEAGRKVRAYRGGYLPNERREIEPQLFAGELRGVAATNALELGIDIGSLDVALLAGYPGTIASTWQQAGRSGRRHDESLAVLLAGNDPVDQYLLRHPDYFFAQSPEHAVVDPENPYVLAKHLPAAAFELPLVGGRRRAFRPVGAADRRGAPRRGPVGRSGRPILFLRRAEPGSPRQPAAHERQHVQHRAAPRTASRPGKASRRPIMKSSPTSMRSARRSWSIPQAVYLHNGESYFVRELDLAGKVAYVERHEMDYYTQAVLESSVVIKEPADKSGRACRDALLGLWRRRRDLADRGLQEDQIRHAGEHRPRPGRHSGSKALNDGASGSRRTKRSRGG